MRNDGGDEERQRVDRERPAGAEPEHERGRERRAGELGHGLDVAAGGLGLLDLLLGHRLRHQPGVGRPEERLGGAEQRLDHDDVPDLDGAGEDQHREQRVQREADQVGDDHHAVARQPVGPHAADQQERDERQRRRREHDARRRSPSRCRSRTARARRTRCGRRSCSPPARRTGCGSRAAARTPMPPHSVAGSAPAGAPPRGRAVISNPAAATTLSRRRRSARAAG